jgi:hypothetical protein
MLFKIFKTRGRLKAFELTVAVIVIVCAISAFAAVYAGGASGQTGTTGTTSTTKTTPTATTVAPKPADPVFDWTVALAMANLGDAKGRALGAGLCIAEIPLPAVVLGAASAEAKMKYVGDLAKVENDYLVAINSGVNHCPVPLTQAAAESGGYGYEVATGSGEGNQVQSIHDIVDGSTYASTVAHGNTNDTGSAGGGETPPDNSGDTGGGDTQTVPPEHGPLTR